MIERHIEVLTPSSVVRRSRGRLSICSPSGDAEDAEIPIDSIGTLTLHRMTLVSVGALLGVIRAGGSVVLCGDSYEPEVMLWPLESHHTQARRFRAQMEAPKPLRKRIWQAIVVRKIRAQAEVLEALRDVAPLKGLSSRVGSGDPENVEAQAARRYWLAMFGMEFRRGGREGSINGMLNYGYAVMRSAIARAVAAAGLHPSISVHHSNARDTFALVDDLMEPYRPLVDYRVAQLIAGGTHTVTPSVKAALSGLLVTDLETEIGVAPVFVAVRRTALSLAQSFEERVVALEFPRSLVPC